MQFKIFFYNIHSPYLPSFKPPLQMYEINDKFMNIGCIPTSKNGIIWANISQISIILTYAVEGREPKKENN